MSDSKKYIFQLLDELGYSGTKTEVRKEFENLFIVIKPQCSRFGENVFLNIGICYKDLMETKTPKFDKSHMEMRFAQLLMALTQKLPVEGERDFHLLQYKEMFLKNYKNYILPFFKKLDNLEEMGNNFPKNMPTIPDEEDDSETLVIYYFQHEESLNKLFKKRPVTQG